MSTLLLALALQDLTDASFERWRDLIRPTPEETVSDGIPWRPEFWGAVKEANAAERPLLLWAMNGHPLACT
jgi:hypothetical protein